MEVSFLCVHFLSFLNRVFNLSELILFDHFLDLFLPIMVAHLKKSIVLLCILSNCFISVIFSGLVTGIVFSSEKLLLFISYVLAVSLCRRALIVQYALLENKTSLVVLHLLVDLSLHELSVQLLTLYLLETVLHLELASVFSENYPRPHV